MKDIRRIFVRIIKIKYICKSKQLIMKYPIGMTLNRTWLAFANKKGVDMLTQSTVLDLSAGEWEEHVFLSETLCIFLCLMSVVYASRWW